MKYFNDWSNLRRVYNYMVTRNQVALIRRHSDALLNPSPKPADILHHRHSDTNFKQSQNFRSNLLNRTQSYPIFHRCHGDYDHNGIALKSCLIQSPDHKRVLKATGILELDECYARRVSGFPSVKEMYRYSVWVFWYGCLDVGVCMCDMIVSDRPVSN